jgi:hypothetical protein
MGSIFGLFAKFSFGRKVLLKYPRFFTCGFFTAEGPTSQELLKGSFETTIEAYSSSSSSSSFSSSGSQPRLSCVVSIKGPEPGYIATPLLFLAMTTMVLHHSTTLNVKAGCVTPASLVGDKDALDVLVGVINKYPGFDITVK